MARDIFRYQTGQGFRSMGFVPGFTRLFKERGIDFPADFFQDQYTVKQVKQKGK